MNRGTKRKCYSCGAPYYDLGRDPVCPKCGAPFEAQTRLMPRGARGKPALAPRPKVVEDAEELETEVDEDLELDEELEEEDSMAHEELDHDENDISNLGDADDIENN